MKYAIITFGCRVNQADSFVIADDLQSRGAVEASPQDADLLIVNTCSVTGAADQGARQTIRRIARENPAIQVIVTGCYATRRPDEMRELPNVTHVVSNEHKDELGDTLAPLLKFPPAGDISTADRYARGDGPCGETLAPGAAGRTALTIRVQTGCDQSCSYCIIPQTRGRGRSEPLQRVVDRVARAVAAGYREIAIAGVHLGSYGRDLDGGTSLLTLLRVLAGWEADVLFRISSLEPMDCTPEIVELIAASPRLAPHVHLPLQHGADEILRAMNRPYTASAYATLVNLVRHRLPHASIGSDVIVGFPGESAAHFDQMEALLHELPVTHLHVFPYSDRPGTRATSLSGKVDAASIRERGRRIRAIGQELQARFRRSQAATVRRALTLDDGWSAVTDNYLKIRLAEQHRRNEWVEVRID